MHTILSKPWTFPSLPVTNQPQQDIKLFGAENGTGEGTLHSKTSNGAARFWILPVQWLNPTLHLGKAQVNKTQLSSAVLHDCILLLENLFFLIDATQWKYYDEKTLQIQDIKVEDRALCQESGEDQDSKPHTPSTPTTSLCPRLVLDSNPHQPLLLPKVVEQAPEAVGMPDPSALCKKSTPKVSFTQAAVMRASNTVPYCNSTSGLFPPFWDLQHPVKGDSASPVARGLMKLRRSLDMHSHTERNRFELEGLCGCLALNLKCTVTPSFFQLKAKCLSSPLKIHGCQNICWSDKLQKQRPHSDSREESHCYKPAPGECSIPTYKTEHYPKVKRK